MRVGTGHDIRDHTLVGKDLGMLEGAPDPGRGAAMRR